ncbi:MAG TPA: bacillithiol transferase BstA [Gemmatimonadaceae bacterium]|nr:bacillithiol transferase BstA [Gemmatimonadaceae bacterium]
MSEDLRYPVGRYTPPKDITEAHLKEWIDQIAEAPRGFRAAVKGLSDSQLDTPYRPGGWTVRQVVHHVPDSHMNAYTRFKLAVTEDEPTIKPYDEGMWAKLPDARTGSVDVSLALLEALHVRWERFLRSLETRDFARKLNHPEHGVLTLEWMLGMYAWHGRHHTTHITALRAREGW